MAKEFSESTAVSSSIMVANAARRRERRNEALTSYHGMADFEVTHTDTHTQWFESRKKEKVWAGGCFSQKSPWFGKLLNNGFL